MNAIVSWFLFLFLFSYLGGCAGASNEESPSPNGTSDDGSRKSFEINATDFSIDGEWKIYTFEGSPKSIVNLTYRERLPLERPMPRCQIIQIGNQSLGLLGSPEPGRVTVIASSLADDPIIDDFVLPSEGLVIQAQFQHIIPQNGSFAILLGRSSLDGAAGAATIESPGGLRLVSRLSGALVCMPEVQSLDAQTRYQIGTTKAFYNARSEFDITGSGRGFYSISSDGPFSFRFDGLNATVASASRLQGRDGGATTLPPSHYTFDLQKFVAYQVGNVGYVFADLSDAAIRELNSAVPREAH